MGADPEKDYLDDETYGDDGSERFVWPHFVGVGVVIVLMLCALALAPQCSNTTTRIAIPAQGAAR